MRRQATGTHNSRNYVLKIESNRMLTKVKLIGARLSAKLVNGFAKLKREMPK